MMKISIFQINMDRDTNRVAFMEHESLSKLQNSPDVDSEIYDKVFTGTVDCETLEDVYEMFNIDHPENYKGRSLSVSDVVEVVESEKVEPGLYFCDSFGYKAVSFEPENVVDKTSENDKISVVILESGKAARIAEIDSSLSGMQAVVGGDIEAVYPFEEDVCVVCNEEGKISGLPLNRALYMPPEEKEVSYEEMCNMFREKERDGTGKHISGYIVFSESSFNEVYSEKSRTYAVSSDNKAFQPNMGGYSINGSAIDGSDPCVRLEQCLRGENSWEIERCYLKGDEREMFDIVAGTAFICDCSGDNFGSLTDEQAKKYQKEFLHPETFMKVNNKIISIPIKEEKSHEDR